MKGSEIMLLRIVSLINMDNPSLEDRLELLEELYWANWSELDDQYPGEVNKVFEYLKTSELTIEEKSKVLQLYNNIEGAHTLEFAEIIADLYKEDRIDFIKALNLSIDEAPHLVYIFRVRGIFEDEDEEFNEVKSFGRLNEVELEAANTFYSMYKNICNT